MTELKPCPFCGEAAFQPIYDDVTKYYFVICDECECEGPAVRTNEADAIAAWNRRPSAGAEPEVVAEEALSVAREIVAAYAAQFGANAPPKPDDDRELVVARALLSVPRSVKDLGGSTAPASIEDER